MFWGLGRALKKGKTPKKKSKQAAWKLLGQLELTWQVRPLCLPDGSCCRLPHSAKPSAKYLRSANSFSNKPNCPFRYLTWLAIARIRKWRAPIVE